MAERLAPERVAPEISSRPERRRGRFGRRLKRTIGAGLALSIGIVGLAVTAHFLAIQQGVRSDRATGLLIEGDPARVLVVLDHPGQEVSMAGTLAQLHEAGAYVSVLSLTAGELLTPPLGAAQDATTLRTEELGRSAASLGIDQVLPIPYQQGEVLLKSPAEVTAKITQAISTTTPSIVIAAADATGQDDEAATVAAYAQGAAQQPGTGVSRVWKVTRGDRELQFNAAFGAGPQQRQIPIPQLAIPIAGDATAKADALAAYATLAPDLTAANYPYADRIPARAYFQFWDREYFSVAWGPVPS